jgi:Spy/CpxP family protein refolding chaperone
MKGDRMVTRLLCAAVLAAAMASAQRGGRPGGEEVGSDIPLLPSRPPNRIEMLSDGLKLKRDQQKQLRSVLDEAQKQAAPVRDRMTKSRLEIVSTIQAGQNQQELDRAVKGYAALEAQMARIEMQAFATIYAGLEPEQRKSAGMLFRMMPGLFKGRHWNESR